MKLPLFLGFCLSVQVFAASQTSEFYNFKVKNAENLEVSLNKYKGKLALVVNVASRCGYTNQYEGLQKLYQTYQKNGFVILGFPSNQFAGQEPGTNQEIQKFCKLTYGVDFPIFAKIDVKGPAADPLYKWLTTQPQFSGEIEWNFNKFLINEKGQVIQRFASGEKPEDIDPIIKNYFKNKKTRK